MNILGMFLKHPLPGRVKTRLAVEIGESLATKLYAAFVGDMVDRFGEIADRRFLCHAPRNDEAASYFQNIAGNRYELWPQPETSLGERLAGFFDHAFSSEAASDEPARVVVIGSDSPTLPCEIIEEAFQLLETHDTVLGPATDGGYYLIGQQATNRPIFQDISWSGPLVLDQTVSRIALTDASLALLPLWYDVDSEDDLELLRGHVRALRYSGSSFQLPRTNELL
jgi:uncharacterized protein